MGTHSCRDLSERVELGDLLDTERYVADVVAGKTTDRLGRLLHALRREVHRDPIPELVTADDAVAIVLAEIKAGRRRRRRLFAAPVAAAAAFLVLAGGTGVGAYSASPTDPLWPVTEALYGEHAHSVAAAYRVELRLAAAKRMLAIGKPKAARVELDAAVPDLLAVRAEDGAQQLGDVHDFLLAKADETPDGQPVDPGLPLATDPERPVPPGAQLGAPVVLQVAEGPLLSTAPALPSPVIPGGGPVLAPPHAPGLVPNAVPVSSPGGVRSPAPAILPTHSGSTPVPIGSAQAAGGGPVEVVVLTNTPAPSASPSPPPPSPAPSPTPPAELDNGRDTPTDTLTATPVAEPTTAPPTTSPETTTAPPSTTDSGADSAEDGAEDVDGRQSTGGGGSSSLGGSTSASTTDTSQDAVATELDSAAAVDE